MKLQPDDFELGITEVPRTLTMYAAHLKDDADNSNEIRTNFSCGSCKTSCEK